MSIEGKLDKVLASQATMQTAQAVMGNDIKHIKEDLSEFKGVTNVKIDKLKTSHYKTKADVNRLKWIATGVATGVSTLWAGAIALFNR